jgi:hypothetical protein
MTQQTTKSLFTPSLDPKMIPLLERELENPANYKYRDVINNWLTDIRLGRSGAATEVSVRSRMLSAKNDEIRRHRNRADSHGERARIARDEVVSLKEQLAECQDQKETI